MWSWNKTGEFIYPGLFHYYTNKNDDEIDFEVKKDLFDNVILIGKDNDNLKKDLIEKKMSLEADYIVDRRRMKRKLSFWRIFTIVILTVVIIASITNTKMYSGDEIIFHKICFDEESLSSLLKKIGFKNLRRWDYRLVDHGIFDDHSQA